MKGLILGAGNGTRLEPFSLAIPKVLLPVANKPIVHYCIEKLVQVNIRDIGIVIKPAHRDMFVAQVGNGEKWGVNIRYIYQTVPLGISDAIKQAESFICDDAFLLLLGDNLIAHALEKLRDSIIADGDDASLLLGVVENPADYGIVEVSGGKIASLEEKPQRPKSNLAILGAYAFGPKLFDAIGAITPSARGEYEITDALQWLLHSGSSMSFHITEREHADIGRPERWLQANRWMLGMLQTEGKLRVAGRLARKKSADGCTIIPPVVIDDSAVVRNCAIGPFVSIGPGARLERCAIRDSIVLEGAAVKDACLEGAIVGPQVSFGMDDAEAAP